VSLLRWAASQAGKGSATLSMAYAAAKFAESCLRALSGEAVVECAYVESHLTELPFFASQVRLGPNGIEVRQIQEYAENLTC
jgi:malate dehydrogenase